MAEMKIERTKNDIVTTIKDKENECKIVQKNENGKACINIESYGKGKLYFQDENGEFKELENATMLDFIDTNNKDNIDYTEFSSECSFEIRDKEGLRKLKKLMKTKKDIQEELQYNKNKFREFIKNRK